MTVEPVTVSIKHGQSVITLTFEDWGNCAAALLRLGLHYGGPSSLNELHETIKTLMADESANAPPIAKFALICDLDQSRFHNKKEEIGGGTQHVKLFGDKSAATKFAADLIRSRTDWIDEAQVTDEETLTAFQDGLGHLEWFHIFAVSE